MQILKTFAQTELKSVPLETSHAEFNPTLCCFTGSFKTPEQTTGAYLIHTTLRVFNLFLILKSTL
mgnify:CR=1 FL=1